MDKLTLPTTNPPEAPPPPRRRRHRWFDLLIVFFTLGFCIQFYLLSDDWLTVSTTLPINAEETLTRCRALNLAPGPPPNFHRRRFSDRYVPGTPATLIRNARIWTGGSNGTEVIQGDLYLDGGVIQKVGSLGRFEAVIKEQEANGALDVVDARGAWVSPGIVDSHSHLGLDSVPELIGSSDTNSLKATILPWLRSVDALNTHDDAYALSIAGGVTTALVLPGSANAIGGQAFTIKLRKTAERSPTAMLLEPPYEINGTHGAPNSPPRWRQMKHACGENPSRVYDATRMDTFWAFRQAYDKARQIKTQQDAYCNKALRGQWTSLGEFPEDLQWEALVDVLRGRVRVQTHCYEAVDLDDLIRLTNEFEFSVAAVHHASEAYLVPDVLKRAYGHTPAAAIFATNGRYKREAYRSSEFAPRILSENGINVVMKSDHPVLNSRYLVYEAQQAHYYGLPDNLALSTVTTHAAQVVGMDHRIGYVKEGYDADLVIWDSHPLALGATPSQVFIDGIAQLDSPFVVRKPEGFQSVPETPNFDKEAALAVEYDGLPSLLPTKSDADIVLFTGVTEIFLPKAGHASPVEAYWTWPDLLGVAVVKNGSLVCYGDKSNCAEFVDGSGGARVQEIDLRGGSISPGLMSYGSSLGLQEIAQEPSTGDGTVFGPLTGKVPAIVRDEVVRAVDGLQSAGRDALLAYRSGVTKAITAPQHRGFFGGLATSFSTGARHKLEQGAVIQEVTALHVTFGHFGVPSVSTQIAALRKLLTALPDDEDAAAEPEVAKTFRAVSQGQIPIVIETHSADVIATLILLKKEVEEATGATFQLTIAGASEAHILAKELAQANIGVILISSHPFPSTWESKRILPGPPLSKDSAITALLAHNVTVGIGVEEPWSARNMRFDIGWAALEAGGRISKSDALALASTNLEKLLGGDVEIEGVTDLVATQGGDLLQFQSKVVAVISPRRGVVDLV